MQILVQPYEKNKKKNKTHVEASICKAYNVEEISTFI
jgi:hypothetical protein